MGLDLTHSLDGKLAVLATMHRKEDVIAPILQGRLGLRVKVPMPFDTDRFGTFSGDIERKGSQLDAARAKIAAGFSSVPEATVGIASEGSFGPDPLFPFVKLGRELVLLVDRETGFELAGHDATHETNYFHKPVTRVEDALDFAVRIGFPDHGVIVTAFIDNAPAPSVALFKGLTEAHALTAAVEVVIGSHGVAFVGADMRASWNPTRMKAIARATNDLVRRFESQCPNCGHRGFDVTMLVPGLPCSWCGEPTAVIKSKVLGCASCGHSELVPATDQATADPGRCDHCNP